MKKSWILCDPMLPTYNPQRGDVTTPVLGIKDTSSCMGNCFQDLTRWVAAKYERSDIGFESTYSYYAFLENWLKQHGWDKRVDAFVSGHHAQAVSEILANAGINLRCVVRKAHLKEIRAHIRTHGRPVILGTRLTGPGGHIVLVVGYGEGYMVVSDPYGEFPYRSHDGWCVEYSDNLLTGKISNAVYLEDT